MWAERNGILFQQAKTALGFGGSQTYTGIGDPNIAGGAFRWAGSGCVDNVPWAEAAQICNAIIVNPATDARARLCSAAELASPVDCGKGTGCQHNSDDIWSSTPATNASTPCVVPGTAPPPPTSQPTTTPTREPVATPTAAPATSEPTAAPVTPSATPTAAPATSEPTAAPITPTAAPATSEPTAAPVGSTCANGRVVKGTGAVAYDAQAEDTHDLSCCSDEAPVGQTWRSCSSGVWAERDGALFQAAKAALGYGASGDYVGSDGFGWRNNGCVDNAPWALASQICNAIVVNPVTGARARLCTEAELSDPSDCGVSTGCRHNRDTIWSSTPAAGEPAGCVAPIASGSARRMRGQMAHDSTPQQSATSPIIAAAVCVAVVAVAVASIVAKRKILPKDSVLSAHPHNEHSLKHSQNVCDEFLERGPTHYYPPNSSPLY